MNGLLYIFTGSSLFYGDSTPVQYGPRLVKQGRVCPPFLVDHGYSPVVAWRPPFLQLCRLYRGFCRPVSSFLTFSSAFR
jgi:hypothetical protein